MKTEGGFTLVEVMVALAVFATLAAVVLTASQYVLKQSVGIEERVFAAWLADNQLSELRLQHKPAAGRQQFSVSFAQRQWTIFQTIVTAEDPRLIEVELRVMLSGNVTPINISRFWLQAEHE